jgi:hypothetical protein
LYGPHSVKSVLRWFAALAGRKSVNRPGIFGGSNS